MSKSYIATLSFIASLIITVCTLFTAGPAVEALALLSKKKLIEMLLLSISSILKLVLPLFIYALIFITLIKLLNTVICKKWINAILSLFDIVVFATCFIIFALNISLLSWIALSASILNFIFNIVFPHAQM